MVKAGVWLVHLLGLEVGLLWLGVGLEVELLWLGVGLEVGLFGLGVGLEVGLLGLGVGQEVGLLRSWFGCGWCRARDAWVDGEVP